MSAECAMGLSLPGNTDSMCVWYASCMFTVYFMGVFSHNRRAIMKAEDRSEVCFVVAVDDCRCCFTDMHARLGERQSRNSVPPCSDHGNGGR